MKLVSDLPLSHVFYNHWQIGDGADGIVVAKAGFHRGTDGLFYVDNKAPELALVEQFGGDTTDGAALLIDQDIVPDKLATDLIIHAIARSPGGTARTDWPVAVRIANRLHYGFHVRGPTTWQKRGSVWRSTAPNAVTEVPIIYRLAYGGMAPGQSADLPEVFAQNPGGQGFANRALLQHGAAFAGAQIGELAELRAIDPLTQMTVHGFGPIAKSWQPRRGLAGTFDDHWQQTRAPAMPNDYDPRFWNVAHRALQLTPTLQGWETIEIAGISHQAPFVPVTLPAASLLLQSPGAAELDQRMVLDTVEIDLRSEIQTEHFLLLTWRARIDRPDRFETVEIFSTAPKM